MNIQEISNEVVGLLRNGKFDQAQTAYFAQDAVSQEPTSANIPEVKGLEAILHKGEQFRNSVEVWHGITVSDPVVSGHHFALQLKVDLTFKGQEPSTMDELIVYQVVDGKIVKEQFFYLSGT